MGLFSRLSAAVRSAVDGALSRAEDPDAAADYRYERMRERLDRIEDALADLTAERKRLEARRSDLRADLAELAERAESAVADGDEDVARTALAAKTEKAAELERVEDRIDEVETIEADLGQKREDLEARVERFRTRKETAKAQRRAGTDPGGSDEEIDRAIARATEEVEGMEARSRALDELESEGAIEDPTTDRDGVDRELESVETDATVEAELRTIKEELGTSAEVDDGDGGEDADGDGGNRSGSGESEGNEPGGGGGGRREN